MINERIGLVKDTISKQDIDALREWLGNYPRLTMGDLVSEFESKFAAWNGSKYSVMVNSGSSANLLAVYALTQDTIKLKNKKAIVPSISWLTSVSPFINFGFTPYLCEASKSNFGIDTNHLEYLCKKHSPDVLLLVHVLGIPCDMDEIQEICTRYG
ncbi:MAG: DegT/DnrJ/EryC1/StrS family aminotransferase, partial [Nanoarchaeota archaeon]